MQVTTSKASILRALNAVKRISGKTATLPVLNYILLEAGPDHLTASGTDLDILCSRQVAVNTDKQGSVLVPVRSLHSLVSGFPEGDVRLTTDDRSVTIEAGSSKYKFNTMPADDFPPMSKPFTGPHTLLAVQSTGFKSALKSVAFAISDDATRLVLNGVYFSVNRDSGTLTLVATDGRRLACRVCEAKVEGMNLGKDGGQPLDIIVPTSAVKEALAQMEEEKVLTITFDSNRIVFKTEDTTLTSKVIDSTFPNYRQVIPTHANSVRFNPKDVAASLRRIDSAVLTDKQNSVKFSLSGIELTIQGSSPDHGEAMERHTSSGAGRDLTIAFNPEYAAQGLESIETDEVTMFYNDELTPLMFRDGEKWLYVVMPVRMS